MLCGGCVLDTFDGVRLPSGTGGINATPSIPSPERITIYGEFVNFADRSPASGLHVCARSGSDGHCVLTGANGKFTITDAPGNRQVVIIAWSDTTVTTILPRTTGSGAFDAGRYLVMNQAIYNAYSSLAGAAADPTKGLLSINVVSASSVGSGNLVGVAGATVELDTGPSFVYSGDNRIPDPTLTGTTVLGAGLATAPNVAAGTVDLFVTPSSGQCESVAGWLPTDPSAGAAAPVANNAVTSVIFSCTP
jgi:hypothetical protein